MMSRAVCDDRHQALQAARSVDGQRSGGELCSCARGGRSSFRLLLKLSGLIIKLDEDPDFGSQHFGDNRGAQ